MDGNRWMRLAGRGALAGAAVVLVALALPVAAFAADGAVVQAAVLSVASVVGAAGGLLEDPAAVGPLVLLLVAGGLATLGLLSGPRAADGRVRVPAQVRRDGRTARARRER